MTTAETKIDQTTTQQERRLIRQLCDSHVEPNISVEIVASPEQPCVEGKSGYYTTPSGKPIYHPSAYHWPKVYHGSTRRITVGAEWIARLRKILNGKAPRGWRYRDKSGLCIERIGCPDCDYHLDADDISGERGPRQWARIARENYALRAENRKLAARVIRDNPLVMVQDSIRAGNCPAGTLRFASAAGITADRLYVGARADKLRKVAERTGQLQRLEPAVVAAWQRENLVSI